MKKLFTLLIFFATQNAFCQVDDRYNKMADSMVKAGQQDKIVPLFETELKAQPHNEALLRWLGYYYIDNNKAAEGEKYYTEALKLNPKCARCYINISRIYARKKDYLKAIDLLNKGLGIDPTANDAYVMRAENKAANKDQAGALADYKKAIQAEPKNIAFLIARGDYQYNQGNKVLALEDYEQALQIAPANYDALIARAKYYAAEEKADRALSDLSAAYEVDSSKASLFVLMGGIFSLMNQPEKAAVQYTKAISIDPNNPEPYYYRTAVRYKMEDMDGACEDNKTTLALLKKGDPENPLIKDLLVSIDDFCDSTNAKYYYQRGIAFYNLNQFEKAVDIYTVGIKKFPENAMMIDFRGNAYLKLKWYKDAITDYNGMLQKKDHLSTDLKENYRNQDDSPEMFEQTLNTFLATTYESMAECYFGIANYNDAMSNINKALAFKHISAGVSREYFYELRANIYMAQNNFPAAIKDFDTSLLINSMQAITYVNRAIAKCSNGEKIKVRTYSLSGTINNQGFNTKWKLPFKTTVKKTNDNILSALADCNRAVVIDPKLDYAYYIRAQVKQLLNDKDYCRDLLRAKELGFPVEEELLYGCGK